MAWVPVQLAKTLKGIMVLSPNSGSQQVRNPAIGKALTLVGAAQLGTKHWRLLSPFVFYPGT